MRRTETSKRPSGAQSAEVLGLKLLVVGSVLVVFSVFGWAATNWTIDRIMKPRILPPAPVYRYVDVDGSSRTSAPVWQTSTGPRDCEVLVERLRREGNDPITKLMSSAETESTDAIPENTCSLFQRGEADRGAKVEVFDDCGPRMSRIRILTGALEGSRGCIEKDLLSERATG